MVIAGKMLPSLTAGVKEPLGKSPYAGEWNSSSTFVKQPSWLVGDLCTAEMAFYLSVAGEHVLSACRSDQCR